MPWIKNFGGFVDFLSLVIVHAPDDFSKENYLGEDEQLTLESAFNELRNGMKFVKPRVSDDAALEALCGRLEQALVLYRQREDTKAAHLLQDFELSLPS
ncbi:hypothetical protein HH212_27005 (plasmid) [Massilia forsythiae]|uniref:Uncharacterized protein n=1 Tax=Massilia forsythiae TaxID=2728020 RepID=A0A7Z2ZX33_9BURK|nr:hypothetical protein [Massilia forsythiae]QJE03747.1 hypothetical protein HH212_27005 [Massilia forsythiae]